MSSGVISSRVRPVKVVFSRVFRSWSWASLRSEGSRTSRLRTTLVSVITTIIKESLETISRSKRWMVTRLVPEARAKAGYWVSWEITRPAWSMTWSSSRIFRCRASLSFLVSWTDRR